MPDHSATEPATFVEKSPESETPTTGIPRGFHRNPIVIAKEWQDSIRNGDYLSRSDLARSKGVSRSRVSQVLRLLGLTPEVIAALKSLGDPLPLRLISEKKLSSLVDASPEEQKQEIKALLRKKGRKIPDW